MRARGFVSSCEVADLTLDLASSRSRVCATTVRTGDGVSNPGLGAVGRPGLGLGLGLGRGCIQVVLHRVRLQPSQRQDVLRRGFTGSAASLQYSLKKMDLPPLESRKFYFDTHAVVRELEGYGFSSKQSEVVVAALLRVMNSSMEVMYKDMATKIQQEVMLQQIMSHITAVKKDMIILEKSEFSAIRAANEKLKIELQQLKKQLVDEVVKISSNNKLDMNLEKSRVQEMLTGHERRVLETRADIVELVPFSPVLP
ncbi:mitochondrial calcium uniporter regulator 1-like isoform X2 [Chiloscyllium plagiosum]|uniref:mitochondrial calcium uniporter regulator 1-like isoform X2 n=1 Tax=Chiloscyllium plagiosum TaxID=36176 RepID=UPI001CB7E8C9|nr:mitochondrial calcium uniporter regulator 1-like isoform X2 [Chiloscyllium plagiosum]